MFSKKYLALFATLLIVVYAIVKIPSLFAAQSNNEQIPSDLALDLELGSKNPAPDQKLIADVQTEKAQIITSTGEQVVIPIQEVVPPEIKTQSAQDAVNPGQTTSEQVVEKTEVVSPGDQPQSSANPLENNSDGSKNTIPGTNLSEPDDNAAPAPESSANPAGNSDSPADTSAPSASAPAEQSNPIPLENGNTQPAVQPPAEPETPAAQSAGDTSAVQGASTVSWWQIFLNKISKVFKK